MATKKKGKSSNKKKTNVKSEKEKINNIKSGFDTNITHYIFVISGVVIFICLFYFLTLYITSKNKDESETDNTAEVSDVFSYSDIMVGRSFSISEGDYFVIYYDKSDEDISSDCSGIVSSYSATEDSLDLYTVDMSNGLNKSYSGEESNKNPTKASDIVINGPTLIKFSGNEVVDYIEGVDNIKSYLE